MSNKWVPKDGDEVWFVFLNQNDDSLYGLENIYNFYTVNRYFYNFIPQHKISFEKGLIRKTKAEAEALVRHLTKEAKGFVYEG